MRRTHCPNGHEYVDGSYTISKRNDRERSRTAKRCLLCKSASGLRSKHGITVEEKQAMLAAQGGRCANRGCVTDTNEYSIWEWQTDHDHRCCKPKRSCSKCRRGLLCRPCNWSLGYMHESLAALAGLIQYLSGRVAQSGRAAR